MNAIILAAGQGTRLRPYTDDRPKGMVELGGQSLLGRQIDVLHACGIDDITIVTGYRGDQIEKLGHATIENSEFETTNMVVSLLCVPPTGHDSTVVTYADILYEPRILRAAMTYEGELGVIIDRSWVEQFRFRFGDRYLEEAEDLMVEGGQVRQIGLPIGPRSRVDGQYIGLLHFSQNCLGRVREIYAAASQAPPHTPWMRGRTIAAAYMTDLVQALIDQGMPVGAIEVDGGWLEVDEASDLEDYRKAWGRDGRLPFYDPSADA